MNRRTVEAFIVGGNFKDYKTYKIKNELNAKKGFWILN